ncbi:craniofacial development protein 2-like [Lingula anatina]|uniref:Craniofacial development protein 2-like n=1 Tax=Lingula anatina TaxID=7574 RepID=A0A1S3JVD4_LINAN|nr:craniofacial development protein 2-like [Lingula anatina]|eukprot:XP_013414021.1 craniofacial development protein 2-like [Lingula anatina]
MTLRLPFCTGKKFLTIVSAYAPTMTNPDEIKEKFYVDIDATINSVSNTDKLFILGDLNARVGSDLTTWEGVVGKHGIGNCNTNRLMLLQTCAEHNFLITNTIFSLLTRNRTS